MHDLDNVLGLMMNNTADLRKDIETLERKVDELANWKASTEIQMAAARWIIGVLIVAMVGVWVQKFVPVQAAPVQTEVRKK